MQIIVQQQLPGQPEPVSSALTQPSYSISPVSPFRLLPNVCFTGLPMHLVGPASGALEDRAVMHGCEAPAVTSL